MNVFTKLPSVQGYGSLISTNYDNSTGTHPQSAVNPCRLADGTFQQLRLSAIAVSFGQLSHNVIVKVPHAPNCRSAPPSATTHRYFGQLLHVATLSIHGRGGRSVTSGSLSVTMLGANGTPVGPTLQEPGGHDVTITFPASAPEAAGFVATGGSAVSIGDAKVTQITPLRITYDLNTPMQEALDSSFWHLSNTVGTFSVFKADTVQPSVWLTSYANATVSHVKNVAYGDTWVTVHATSPVTLVRSMAYLPGWRATALNTRTGKSVALKVTRNGLIQQVVVPSGPWQIHFHYHAPYIEVSLAASMVGVVLLLGVGIYLVIDLRRRREIKVRT
jgi:hypothetical protein